MPSIGREVLNSRFSLFLLLILLSCYLQSLTDAGVILTKSQQGKSELGLYNETDQVVVLTNANFNATVFSPVRSCLVEFYNSYCGHCRRFAPQYKILASQLLPWSEVMLVTAIDCAAEENNGNCREYEIMGYPTLRYFGPGFAPSSGHFGQQLDSQQLPTIRSSLAQLLSNENVTSDMKHWPHFRNLTASEEPFDGLPSERLYVALIYEPENSTISAETTLNLLRWPMLEVRRVTNLETAEKYKIDGTRHKISIIDRKGVAEPQLTTSENARSYTEIIESFLRIQNAAPKPIENHPKRNGYAMLSQNNDEAREIIAAVQRHMHYVYQADLELAVRGILHNEIPKVADISAEKLLALQKFLTILDQYNPMGANGRAVVSQLKEFVSEHNQKLNGGDFSDKVEQLESKYAPTYTANRFVGCVASAPGLRGYTCSLWTLFHFMTVYASRADLKHSPLEVLDGIHGYVKNFFGCTECSSHFQEMAARRKMWNITSNKDAVLWLWTAHNEVNQRIAGDSTEDQSFPKIQFPSSLSCPGCYKEPRSTSAIEDIKWDNDVVYTFLNHIHDPSHISQYGIGLMGQMGSSAERLRQSPTAISNMFSDMDMFMGILLYGFCIFMVIVAFKLFVLKGYRKKPYEHDVLGKI